MNTDGAVRWNTPHERDDLLVERAAEAAADWWAARLADGAGVGDNGDTDSRRLGMSVLLTRMTRAGKITPEHVKLFREHLVGAICAQLEGDRGWRDASGWDDGGVSVQLGVDYHPDPTLAAALVAAGISENVASMSALPFKTCMKVSRRTVRVAHGYRNPFVEIYGPVWGCSLDEQAAAERARDDEMQRVREAYRASLIERFGEDYYQAAREASVALSPGEWQGPVRS